MWELWEGAARPSKSPRILSPLWGWLYCVCIRPMACADGLLSFAAPRLGWCAARCEVLGVGRGAKPQASRARVLADCGDWSAAVALTPSLSRSTGRGRKEPNENRESLAFRQTI